MQFRIVKHNGLMLNKKKPRFRGFFYIFKNVVLKYLFRAGLQDLPLPLTHDCKTITTINNTNTVLTPIT